MNQTAAVNHAPGPDTPNGSILEPYTPEVLAELRSDLDAADRATADDAVAHRRVAFLRRGFDFTEIQATAHSFLRRAKDLTPEEKTEAQRLLDRRWVMMRQLFDEEPYAVNVTAVMQGEDRRFKSLWTGPSAAAREAVASGNPKNAHRE